MKKNAKYFLCLIFLIPTALSAMSLSYSTGPLNAGETLAVFSNKKFEGDLILIWNEYEAPFYKTRKNNFRALIRVPLEVNSGPQTLVVKSALKSETIEIKTRTADFGKETINFTDEKAKLLNDPSEDEESKLIRVFLSKHDRDARQLWKGLFLKPLPGMILSQFGIQRKKIGQNKPDFHRGIDIQGHQGEVIQAANNGVVIMVRDFKFHGKTVLLSHGQGVATIGIHMDSILVKEGQKVKKGQNIGTVGSTGLATGPHLHWGLYVHGKAVNPIQWLETSF